MIIPSAAGTGSGGYSTHLGVKLKAFIVLAGAILLAVTILALTSSLWSGGFVRFVGSDRVKTGVTIIVVGFSAFITGFGLRDVLSRWYGYRSRRALANKKAA